MVGDLTVSGVSPDSWLSAFVATLICTETPASDGSIALFRDVTNPEMSIDDSRSMLAAHNMDPDQRVETLQQVIKDFVESLALLDTHMNTDFLSSFVQAHLDLGFSLVKESRKQEVEQLVAKVLATCPESAATGGAREHPSLRNRRRPGTSRSRSVCPQRSHRDIDGHGWSG